MWGPGPPQGQASDEGDPPGGPSGVPAAAAAAAAAVPAVDDLGGLDPALEADAVRQAAAGMLLPFQRALLEELLEEDGLCVLSPGLGLHQASGCCWRHRFLSASSLLAAGCPVACCRPEERHTTRPTVPPWLQVVAALLRLQDARLHAPGQRGVVLVLGAAPWQRDLLRRELLRIDPAIAERAAAAIGARAAGRWALPACCLRTLPCASLLAWSRPGGACRRDQQGVCSRAAAPHLHLVVCCRPPSHLPAAALEVPAEVTNEVAAAERQALYATRSCLFVTTRILVVDQVVGWVGGC